MKRTYTVPSMSHLKVLLIYSASCLREESKGAGLDSAYIFTRHREQYFEIHHYFMICSFYSTVQKFFFCIVHKFKFQNSGANRS